jgi:hypothetical protein
MNKLGCTLLLVFWPLLAQGQNNETVKEVVTVKRVITNDGQNITISEEQSTQHIKGTVVVSGDSIVNQSSQEKKIQFNDTIMAQEQRIKDSLNQAKVAELKAARAAELEASIQAQNKKAEVQKKALEEAFKKQIEDLKAKRKALMKKPDNR